MAAMSIPQEYINPKSMAAPGVAGALMMFLVNGVTSVFPEIPPRYLALGVSFLIALMVFESDEIKEINSKCIRAVYWVIVSLVIFVVGFGSAYMANSITNESSSPKTHEKSSIEWVSKAFAQPPGSQAIPIGKIETNADLMKKLESLKLENKKLKIDLKNKKSKIDSLKKKSGLPNIDGDKTAEIPNDKKPDTRQFFKKW